MGFYIAPQFLDRLAVHITKNYLDLPNVKVPLILGVHGRKGEGKSFQCDLVFERMGIEVIYMSAGELESPDAGDPGRLIRLRYREAGERCRIRGKMAVLLINDIDAGIGRVDGLTQYTVNTQLVHGTLMNIADTPTNVQLPGSYDSEPTQRIPIIVTGNDFSTLYAPLVRDGRMEKYYWEPTRDDRLGIVAGIFEVDQVARGDIEQLVETFLDQSIDFFGALRSRLYDEQVVLLIQNIGIERISARVVNGTEALPEFHRPDFRLSHLLEVGQAMVREQQRIQELRLVEEYHQSTLSSRSLSDGKSGGRDRRNRIEEPVMLPVEPSSKSYAGDANSTQLTPALVSEVNRILNQGHRLGIEYVDARRFRTGSWQCFGVFERDGAAALEALAECLTQHPQAYVRIVDIEPQQRIRLTEQLVQRGG
ncbi:ribulose bisphosphate carboxylase small subunit [filamentous cyanobacterium LEGE 11480]|uniref:Ribulose bisphosphate carboxylase small subunit n=1 Tax=Romeriopsis navalis LEGE 11480 TaxID=2777977 RepID=A0A928VUW2_9CYAN|nr:ribulose bisphosphate carboxylase small subunit [Romeriopsis navalis]MBE9032962.1 ribulose bisphosphate carboxylase small subunit [Romeriopsis navalis LEGE 11480]